MKKFFQATLLLFVILYNFESAESLSCVVCQACTNPWSNATDPITACPTGSDRCLKTNIAYPGGGIMIKGCVPESSCSDQEIMLVGYGFSMTCCSTDGCNSAGSIQIKYFALIVSVLIAIFVSAQN